jgi:AcrR family transcriptional regulator
MIRHIRYSRSEARTMKSRKTPVIAVRKRPQQARSERLVADILQAATRVLAREGARRFTTARVAEAAGVSVGSLYQYFPNKEAILFRLQVDEWNETAGLLQGILADGSWPPFERLRLVARAFFRSECEEASLRVALGDATPLHRDAPEAKEHRRSAERYMLPFMEEILPATPAKQRRLAAGVVTMTLSTLGKKASEQGRPLSEVDVLAIQVGDMLCAYLEKMRGAT